MSAKITLLTLMIDEEVLCVALSRLGEKFIIKDGSIIVTSKAQDNSVLFQKNQNKYTFISNKENTMSDIEEAKTWLKNLNDLYNSLFKQKMKMLREDQRKNVEKIMDEERERQIQKIIEKALKKGYKIEKRVNNKKQIKIVLVQN